MEKPVITQTVRYGVVTRMSDSEIKYAGGMPEPGLVCWRQYTGSNATTEGFEDRERAEWIANSYLDPQYSPRVAVITRTVERYPDRIVETRVLEVEQ